MVFSGIEGYLAWIQKNHMLNENFTLSCGLCFEKLPISVLFAVC